MLVNKDQENSHSIHIEFTAAQVHPLSSAALWKNPSLGALNIIGTRRSAISTHTFLKLATKQRRSITEEAPIRTAPSCGGKFLLTKNSTYPPPR